MTCNFGEVSVQFSENYVGVAVSMQFRRSFVKSMCSTNARLDEVRMAMCCCSHVLRPMSNGNAISASPEKCTGVSRAQRSTLHRSSLSQFLCSFGEVLLKLRHFGFGYASFDAVSVKFR